MSVRVFAPAKINLTLQVGRPRADGLHPLQSIVTFADVGDVVEAAESDTLSLSIEGEFAEGLAADDSNLVIRAARALADAAGLAPRAALSLEKNLPVASGIGGGSSDAAAALHALNKLWALNYSSGRLQDIARKLGADVPVCVGGAPSYMTGAGEAWAPLAAPALSAVLVNPLQPLATGDVYHRFDAMGLGASFAQQAAPTWPDFRAALAGMAAIGNDLAAPARDLMPAIAEIDEVLRADGRVLYVAMSGSGATMFAITADDESAASLADALQAAHPQWWVTDTRLGAA
jgi:4-diphosphocytidyl-2-C-methyl-D-erythritol kinase